MGRPRKQTTDPKEQRHLELVRSASAARHRAMNRLREAHADDYEQFYTEEAAKVGVTPRTERYKKRREELLAELAKLEVLEAKARGYKAPMPAQGARGRRNGK